MTANPLSPGKPRVYAAAAALTAIPLIIWATMLPLASRFGDLAGGLQALGQVTGLAGLALFSASLLLSARFRWVERLLGPLDQVYACHHLIGGLALGLLLIHPLALFFFYQMAKPELLTTLVVPGLQGPITWGILSLWLLIVLLVLTLYLRPRYGVWRRTHQLLGLSLFLGGLHGLTVSSDISVSLPLRVYLLGLAAVALVAYVVYTVLNRWSVRRYRYRVAEAEHLSSSVIRLKLVPEGPALPTGPGQFVFLRLRLNGRWGEAHPFSIASPPAEDGSLELHIKTLGDGTTDIHDAAAVGDRALLEGPFGSFGQEARGAGRVICVAGGIGVTPFLSLLPTLDPDCRLDIVYTVRDRRDAVHLPALEKLTAARPAIRLFPWFSDQSGHLTGQAIKEMTGLEPDSQMFLCGPAPMMLSVQAQCQGLGLPAAHIHFEMFALD